MATEVFQIDEDFHQDDGSSSDDEFEVLEPVSHFREYGFQITLKSGYGCALTVTFCARFVLLTRTWLYFSEIGFRLRCWGQRQLSVELNEKCAGEIFSTVRWFYRLYDSCSELAFHIPLKITFLFSCRFVRMKKWRKCKF